MESIRDRITSILERWYLSEPAMFQVLCTHEIVENTGIACPVRCGRRRVEYNPLFLENMSDTAVDEALRVEAVRILLKHPYERKPDQCSNQAIAVGSNITVGDNYSYGAMKIEKPSDYDLKEGMPYEWYSRRIQEMLPPGASVGRQNNGGDGSSSGNGGESDRNSSGNKSNGMGEKLQERSKSNSDVSELWEEDDLTVAMINGIIDTVKSWGTLSGQFGEKIKASTKTKINWRNVLSGFRSSILSSRRRLTRMRPNRRSGFEQMGSTKEFSTKLLVAVDVSGSISSEMLSYFYGVINSAFKYGIESIDVAQFDMGIRNVYNLKKVIKDVSIIGRGGTSFDQPIMYAHENKYDGLIILTDGYAPQPIIPDGFKTKILWICENKRSYAMHHGWMEKLGRVCTLNLESV